MRLEATRIADVRIVIPETIADHRGFFQRRFCSREFEAAGIKLRIVQINRSLSTRQGTVRGLHYQMEPMSEYKIVQCFKGRVFDVAVDLRERSPTFLQWHAEILDGENGRALCIPHGFAHGFQTLEENSEIIYFTDQFYDPEYERTVNYADPVLNIPWPEPVTAVSERDRSAPMLKSGGKPE